MSFVAKAEEFFKLIESGKGAAAIAPFLKTQSAQRFECQAPALGGTFGFEEPLVLCLLS